MTDSRTSLISGRIVVALALFVATLSASSAFAGQKQTAAVLSGAEQKAFDKTIQALAASFLKNDTKAFRQLCISKEHFAEVASAKLLKLGAERFHKKMLLVNTKRFTESRVRFKDLSGFKFVSATVGYRLSRSDAYSDPKLVLKNSFFTISDANRVSIRIKVEEIVYIAGKYFLMKLD